jgi:Concanavalin A-like lectin/glucanases superfamily
MRIRRFVWAGLAALISSAIGSTDDRPPNSVEPGLVGYWKLKGDCLDHSGNGNHGINHGVVLDDGSFDGTRAYVEVPASDSLRFGAGDFAFSVWVYTPAQVDDAIGDVLDCYDPAHRRGLTLSVNSSASGYLSQGTDRHVYFGIDNAKLGEWQDCGRPSPTSPYVSNSMLVFKGHLYAAIIEGATEADWCHVYRYEGGKQWVDCGRVGNGRTTGVGPLLVHQGELYAVTTTYDWTRVQNGQFDPGRVYRYAGGTQWEDCGEPNSDQRTLNCAASYRNKLYVGGGPKTWGISVRQDDGSWRESIQFPKSGPKKCFPHAMSRYNGRLYVGWPSVYSFDGADWSYAGVPIEPEATLQTHSFAIFQGHLIAGTWPLAKVAKYHGGEQWEDIGRVGEDGTEVNSLLVYNGMLYGGSIPRAEVCRYDGEPQWTSLRRFYSPDGWTPEPPVGNGGNPTREQVAEWSRVTSMTIYRGRLFASTGNCTSSIQDSPADIRGTVHSLEAGKCVSYDDELAAGWRHLAAVREGDRLKLYVDGRLVAESSTFNATEYELSTPRPLRIGFGQTDYFHGRMSDVRAYNRVLTDSEIRLLSTTRPID